MRLRDETGRRSEKLVVLLTRDELDQLDQLAQRDYLGFRSKAARAALAIGIEELSSGKARKDAA